MAGIAALVVLPMQVWARNYILYQDPLSPMLEFMKAHPDAQAVGVADYFRSAVFYSQPAWKLLMSFVVVRHLAQFGGSLGIGVLAFIPALRGRRLPLIMVASGALVIILVIGAQQMPRFFVEPYLWAAVVAAGAPEGTWKALLKGALAIQGCVVAAIAVYYAVVLFPGALTMRGRDYAMERAAYSYGESRDLNSRLPDGNVLTMVETHALLRPPFTVLSETFHMPADTGFARAAHDLSDGPATVAYLQQSVVDYFVKADPALALCFAHPMDNGVRFRHQPLRWYAPNDDQVWQLFRLTRGCAGGGKGSDRAGGAP